MSLKQWTSLDKTSLIVLLNVGLLWSKALDQKCECCLIKDRNQAGRLFSLFTTIQRRPPETQQGSFTQLCFLQVYLQLFAELHWVSQGFPQCGVKSTLIGCWTLYSLCLQSKVLMTEKENKYIKGQKHIKKSSEWSRDRRAATDGLWI